MKRNIFVEGLLKNMFINAIWNSEIIASKIKTLSGFDDVVIESKLEKTMRNQDVEVVKINGKPSLEFTLEHNKIILVETI